MITLTVLAPQNWSDKQNANIGLYSGVLFLGLAITFGILWLRRKTEPTDWAKYPAAGLLVLSILAFILGDAWNTLSDQTKAIAFAVASAVFLVCYLVNGLRKWGWLFPTLVCAAIALTSWMITNNIDETKHSGNTRWSNNCKSLFCCMGAGQVSKPDEEPCSSDAIKNAGPPEQRAVR